MYFDGGYLCTGSILVRLSYLTNEKVNSADPDQMAQMRQPIWIYTVFPHSNVLFKFIVCIGSNNALLT
jgi:hypothetical protein